MVEAVAVGAGSGVGKLSRDRRDAGVVNRAAFHLAEHFALAGCLAGRGARAPRAGVDAGQLLAEDAGAGLDAGFGVGELGVDHASAVECQGGVIQPSRTACSHQAQAGAVALHDPDVAATAERALGGRDVSVGGTLEDDRGVELRRRRRRRRWAGVVPRGRRPGVAAAERRHREGQGRGNGGRRTDHSPAGPAGVAALAAALSAAT